MVLRGVGIWLLQNWRIGDFLAISLCYTNFHLVKPFNSDREHYLTALYCHNPGCTLCHNFYPLVSSSLNKSQVKYIEQFLKADIGEDKQW
ncbi:hypothetical protein [Nostoc sp. S13]|uniref:hypothetical protein n=1 Tax=Nostoc sp. S13 TaxID=3019266 RepID=UPI00260B8503|nr:hypothetical protein [Nostoc sp. S13]MDF5736083.1 hypothetical protein [Nostoc sp. S13]